MRNFSFLPSTLPSRTTHSISRCDVMPTSFRNLRTAMLKLLSSTAILPELRADKARSRYFAAMALSIAHDSYLQWRLAHTHNLAGRGHSSSENGRTFRRSARQECARSGSTRRSPRAQVQGGQRLSNAGPDATGRDHIRRCCSTWRSNTIFNESPIKGRGRVLRGPSGCARR